MLQWWIKPNSRVLFVDNAELVLDTNDRLLDIELGWISLPDVVDLDGDYCDAIVFPTRPPRGILAKAFEKIVGGGHIIILGYEDVIENIECTIVNGDPGITVFRRTY